VKVWAILRLGGNRENKKGGGRRAQRGGGGGLKTERRKDGRSALGCPGGGDSCWGTKKKIKRGEMVRGGGFPKKTNNRVQGPEKKIPK